MASDSDVNSHSDAESDYQPSETSVKSELDAEARRFKEDHERKVKDGIANLRDDIEYRTAEGKHQRLLNRKGQKDFQGTDGAAQTTKKASRFEDEKTQKYRSEQTQLQAEKDMGGVKRKQQKPDTEQTASGKKKRFVTASAWHGVGADRITIRGKVLEDEADFLEPRSDWFATTDGNDNLTISHKDLSPNDRIKVVNCVGLIQEAISDEEQKECKGNPDTSKVIRALKRKCNGKGRRIHYLDPDMWLVKGMTLPIFGYQLQGLAFMRDRENSQNPPFGGFQGDMPGLGKSVQMIANIANGKPKGKQLPKATLIVAPAGLIQQWVDEIRRFCDPKIFSKILHYKKSMDYDERRLSEQDIIITSYEEVLASYPKNHPPNEIEKEQDKQSHWISHYEEHKGVLHRVHFLRVVLDEATRIKAPNKRTSIACRALMANHRWLMSGTPLEDDIVEAYSYFKFLQHPLAGDLRTFKKNFGNGKKADERSRLSSLMSTVMIRRRHNDMFLGKCILGIPNSQEITIYVGQNKFEHDLYEAVLQHCLDEVNMCEDNGRKAGSILNMVWRLREINGHPLLAQDALEDCTPDSVQKLRRVAQEEHQKRNFGGPWLQSLMRRLIEQLWPVVNIEEHYGKPCAPVKIYLDEEMGSSSDNLITSSDNPAESSREKISPVPAISTGRIYGVFPDPEPLFKCLDFGGHGKTHAVIPQCCSCQQEALDPFMTTCHHIYCKKCLKALGAEFTCFDCNAECSSSCTLSDVVTGLDSAIIKTSIDTEPVLKKVRRDPKSSWLHQDGPFMASSKTLALKALILIWLHQDPGTKIIVFTQMIDMIHLLCRICKQEKWDYQTYHGKQDIKARAQSLAIFQQDPKFKILLATSMVCSEGLNITAASKVVVLDPWWNEAMDRQAFCRVFRTGQSKQTTLVRIVVKKTVDTRILALQSFKKLVIEDVLDHTLATRLPLKVLVDLFMPIGCNSKGFTYKEDIVFPPDSYASRKASDNENSEQDGGEGEAINH